MLCDTSHAFVNRVIHISYLVTQLFGIFCHLYTVATRNGSTLSDIFRSDGGHKNPSDHPRQLVLLLKVLGREEVAKHRVTLLLEIAQEPPAHHVHVQIRGCQPRCSERERVAG